VVVVVGATVVVVVGATVVVVVGATVVVVLRAVTRTREFPTTVSPGIGLKRGIQSPLGASGWIQNSP
jgi:orotidine-5'-phosphate decarboxylase